MVMRWLAILLLPATLSTRAEALRSLETSLRGRDVVVLKDGGKVSGGVVDKGTFWEVTTEGGVRTYLKEEVEKILTSPKEILGDSDKLIDEAKAEYEKGLAASSGQDAIFRAAAEKVKKARTAYSEARELFPEEKYADLDAKLVQIIQLLRMLRERMSSQMTGGTVPKRDPAPTPKVEPSAFDVLRDPAKRADAANRQAAIEKLRGGSDLSIATVLFLSRSDAEWRLQGASLEAVQDYLKRPWVQGSLTSQEHLDAAKWISERYGKLDAPEALKLFGVGHIASVPAGADRDKVARALGLEIANGVVGTAEGNVAIDLANWIRAGDNDLAVLAWLKEFRAVDTANVRYAWSVALLRLAHQRGRGFERAIGGLEGIKQADAALAAHIAALIKSIKAAMNCGTCGGDGKWRCTNCQGKKDIKVVCKACEGTGKMKTSSGFQLENCPKCKSTGIAQTLHCTKCKDGFMDCSRCDGPRKCPAGGDICTTRTCSACSGTGSVFLGVRWTCRACRGLGEILVPKSDATTTLDSK